ncbi:MULTISPECIES: helix-turn-helix domain-containing protein [unclassified Kitasatospora]|uniref:helix-turn-helix domain-containing protein n=1 Tax=unclassified Kitasatospora TaxID=2633591 RepID=UPI0038010B5C
MPPRRHPTLRQRRLGAELRRIREAAALSGPQLAKILDIDVSQISQMENGKAGVSRQRIRAIAGACKCLNDPLIYALGNMTQDRTKGWWEEYRGLLHSTFLESAEHEDFAAGSMKVWSTTFLPGLLQTGDYAKGVFGRKIPSLTVHEIDLHTAFRTQRRSILMRNPQKKIEAYLNESCLHTRFGGTSVLRQQLNCLIEDSHRENISIRVVPFTVHTHPGPTESLIYSFGDIPELDTIEIDTSRGPAFFDSPNELESYRAIFNRIEMAALSEEESRNLISETAQNLKD